MFSSTNNFSNQTFEEEIVARPSKTYRLLKRSEVLRKCYRTVTSRGRTSFSGPRTAEAHVPDVLDVPKVPNVPNVPNVPTSAVLVSLIANRKSRVR